MRYIGRGTFVKEGYAALERFHDRAAEICSPAEVIEACLLIEPQLAYVAALRAESADYRTLEECIENARKAETTIEFDKWDNRFHTALVAMSRNNFLINLYEGISHVRREDNWNRLKEQTTTEDIRKKNLAHLKAIAEAIRNRAPAEAESAMRNHLLSVQADLSP